MWMWAVSRLLEITTQMAAVHCQPQVARLSYCQTGSMWTVDEAALHHAAPAAAVAVLAACYATVTSALPGTRDRAAAAALTTKHPAAPAAAALPSLHAAAAPHAVQNRCCSVHHCIEY